MQNNFRIELVRATQNPQQVCWLAMHQDYSAYPVVDRLDKYPSEVQSGEYLVRHCLKHNHFGPLEHVQITLNCIGFQHSTVMQLRTHRIGTSFDVQSFRYCSQSVLDVASGKSQVTDVFALRQPGEYTDRQGGKYFYSEQDYKERLNEMYLASVKYSRAIAAGQSEEHARELIPFGISQHFVLSLNARSLMHVLDNRAPANAQLEAQQFSHLLFKHFSEWMPQVADWYAHNRLGKNKLAP